MNRLVLIGNGFDLAHGLKTSYKDFIYWYWKQRIVGTCGKFGNTSDDGLCTITVLGDATWNTAWSHYSSFFREATGKELLAQLSNPKKGFQIRFTPFFENIHKSLETKKWVDIENEYYQLLEKYTLVHFSEIEICKLNNQLAYLQKLLTEYLSTINKQDNQKKKKIKREIYEPIRPSDISIEATTKLKEHIEWCKKQDNEVWKLKLSKYGINGDWTGDLHEIDEFFMSPPESPMYPRAFMLPENIMLLDFNYTKTGREYLRKVVNIFSHIYIHGKLEAPDGMIFGYGDEFDDKYKKLQALNNNECLANIKTIKYQESDNYRKVLQFIDSAPFQVCIMGHSCGNSDRTLLNTIFEHKNCISIKPYFYKKDDGTDSYIEIIQNISRNFKDMKLMRDRVVNKLYCETLAQD